MNYVHCLSVTLNITAITSLCSVDNFERFIIELASTVKHNTLKVYSWAVQTYHLASSLPSPTWPLEIKYLMGKMEEVKLNNGEFFGQAAAFNLKHLEVLKQAYSKSERLIDVGSET